MNFIPTRGLLLIRTEEPKSSTDGGIFIPDSAQEAISKGEVVRVGGDRIESGSVIDTELQEGDTVWFGKYAGTALSMARNFLCSLRSKC